MSDIGDFDFWMGEWTVQNRRLRERRRELRDPQALEREARRLGMVKAGEKSYVVELPASPSKATP